ncbi:cobalt-precorrin 5A hydrolase [Paraburkholderia caballeronis]|uniref:cobalamin biosynthesis protein n=1 Tax=Paraburkholderia caballeronis TaxID=416943 RepID=UPI001066CC1E|nr:cobalamin biosynthesis protein [Paraburkholderia caballeronis]TDV25583.1 cobalt-precorrin 5A hydrolase [Paraburkholderia caballeronis]
MNGLTIGIGCRRDSTAAQIGDAVRAALGARGLDTVAALATVADKAREPGLVEFCASHALPLRTFSREAIAAFCASHPLAAPSAATRARFGIDGVCEPCALLAAGRDGRLIVAKTVRDGIAVAIACAADANETPSPSPRQQDPAS